MMLGRSEIAETQTLEVGAHRLLGLISTGLMWCSATMLGVAIIVLNMSIIKRTFGQSVFWEFELTIYLVVSAVFLASPYTMRTGGHVAIDMIGPMLPERIRAGYRCVIMLSTLVICAYLTLQMGHLAFDAWVNGERTRTLWNPLIWPVYATATLGLGLTALEIICRMPGFRGNKTGRE